MRFAMIIGGIVNGMIAIAVLAIFAALMMAFVPSFVMPFSPFWGAAYGVPAVVTALLMDIR